MDIPHLVTAGPPTERWTGGHRRRGSSRGAEFNLHPRLPDLHEAVADVLERANLTSARMAVVFAAERSLRALMLQDAVSDGPAQIPHVRDVAITARRCWHSMAGATPQACL